MAAAGNDCEKGFVMGASSAVAVNKLLGEFDAGSFAALARVVSIVENHREGFDEILARLHSRTGRARRMGMTGPPGAGKSTVTTLLAQRLRADGHRVGIIAVDPTSPFTGGALLGDRVRMELVALDPGVFIRSMATRGSLGGLAATTREVADVLDGFGFDRIIIETVGVGQSELEVARTADSTVVVLVPESGDSIQTLKAGVMEIADIFVVNKADRPGADRLRNDVELMLGLRKGAHFRNMPAHHGGETQDEGWTPPVLRTVAVKDEGTTELLESLNAHFAYLEKSGSLQQRRRARLRERVVDAVELKMRGRLWSDSNVASWLDGELSALENGTETPYGAADRLLAERGALVTRAKP